MLHNLQKRLRKHFNVKWVSKVSVISAVRSKNSLGQECNIECVKLLMLLLFQLEPTSPTRRTSTTASRQSRASRWGSGSDDDFPSTSSRHFSPRRCSSSSPGYRSSYRPRWCREGKVEFTAEQSWALSVFLNLFNDKKGFFAIFIK